MSARDATNSIQQLLVSLEKLSPMLEGRDDDLQFLRDMLVSNEFHSLITLQKEVNNASAEQAKASHLNGLSLVNMISYDCEQESKQCPEAKELVNLLSSPHIEALISAHDKIANKEYPVQAVASLPAAGETKPGDNQPVRIIKIEKGTDPLGATVKSDQEGNIVISRVLVGGAADKCGLLTAGDIIHQINGEDVHGYSVDSVADLMKGLTGSVAFMITPVSTESRVKKWDQPRVHMRGLFSYDPSVDRHHPCQEAGLWFEVGTVLEIVNQDDPNWWQAVRDGDKRTRAGIIPSKAFKERLELYDSIQQQPTKRKSKGKTTPYSTSMNASGHEIITYEEVVKINPQVERPRPILIIAPRGPPFDLNGLKARLLQRHPDIYGTPIAHTSRDQNVNEVNSVDFYFVSRRQMEQDIQNNHFVEHAFYEGHYYGTSVNAIRKVINDKKTCLLIVAPQSIKYVRTSEMRPFLVYFKPPAADYMKQHWVRQNWMKESSIADLIRQAAHLEQNYGHYIDHTIQFHDMSTAQREITHITNRLKRDQQWVPASWANVWQD